MLARRTLPAVPLILIAVDVASDVGREAPTELAGPNLTKKYCPDCIEPDKVVGVQEIPVALAY